MTSLYIRAILGRDIWGNANGPVSGDFSLTQTYLS